ncbi:MAG TPA: hypothetical protein ENH13_06750 [Euryarchaeota archaeon]|nr:hypothetical protein [Euryarchaeota archaeon]
MAIENLLFYQEMLKQAYSDGAITKEAHAILDVIREKYGIYERHVEQAMKDGIISDEESRKLREIRKEIYKTALETALQSGNITDDELVILNILRCSIGFPDEVLIEIEKNRGKPEDSG